MKKTIAAALILVTPLCLAHDNRPASLAYVDTAVAGLQEQLYVTPTSIGSQRQPASIAYVDAKIATVQAEIDANPAIAHPVGSYYGGGVVYYVNPAPNPPAGQQGLIVAINNVNTSPLAWYSLGSTGTLITTSTGLFTGQVNTYNIIQTALSQGHTAPAASAASEYTTTETCPTCTPWYLPSLYELSTMYPQIDLINASAVAHGGTALALTAYWGSSQLAPVYAWFVVFGNGIVYEDVINGVREVRSVRAF